MYLYYDVDIFKTHPLQTFHLKYSQTNLEIKKIIFRDKKNSFY